MLKIPEITPVRAKTESISPQLINPGSRGFYFPAEAGPRVVYLDERFDYPAQTGNDPDAERSRQEAIWRQVNEAGATQFLDSEIEPRPGEREIREAVYGRLGTRNTAEFYQQVFSELLEVPNMDIVIISTGVRPYDGYNYRDIGYLTA